MFSITAISAGKSPQKAQTYVTRKEATTAFVQLCTRSKDCAQRTEYIMRKQGKVLAKFANDEASQVGDKRDLSRVSIEQLPTPSKRAKHSPKSYEITPAQWQALSDRLAAV